MDSIACVYWKTTGMQPVFDLFLHEVDPPTANTPSVKSGSLMLFATVSPDVCSEPCIAWLDVEVALLTSCCVFLVPWDTYIIILMAFWARISSLKPTLQPFPDRMGTVIVNGY